MEEDVTGESEEWETPNNSVMPFGRIDLEIWLNTDLGMDFSAWITATLVIVQDMQAEGTLEKMV